MFVGGKIQLMSQQVDVHAVSNQEMEKNTHVLPVSPVATNGIAS